MVVSEQGNSMRYRPTRINWGIVLYALAFAALPLVAPVLTWWERR